MNGRRKGVSTHTEDTEHAKTIAAKAITASLDGDDSLIVEGVRPRGGKLATFADVMRLQPKEYGKRLTEMMITARGAFRPLDTLDALTPALIAKFQARCQGRARPDYEIPCEHNGSANATLRHVKAMFGAKAMAEYQRRGLNVPDMRGVTSARELQEDRWRYSDAPLTRKQVADMASALPRLKTAAPAVWREHLRVALEGRASRIRELHARWLSQFGGVTVEQVRWHCGAAWLAKTGSLALAAEKMGVTETWAAWHYGRMKVGKVVLKVGDL